MASNICCQFSERFDNIKACLMLMVAFLVFFSYFQKIVDFFMTTLSFGIFCFRINWRLTSSCWLSRGPESTESLPIASVVFLVCFFLRLNFYFQKKYGSFYENNLLWLFRFQSIVHSARVVGLVNARKVLNACFVLWDLICHIPRLLFFWHWIFRIPMKMLIFFCDNTFLYQCFVFRSIVV